LKTNASTNPTRIIAPASALTPGVKPPLLIALHGMGGDENMFPDAYGNGRLKALADKHAFILVSPRVDLTTFTSPKAVDAFLDDLASMYEFDRDRVYVIGHSMGAGAAAYIARNSITKVAAVACLAGGPQRPVLRSVAPMLVFGAELDPIISAATLEAAARASEAAGFSVEYREAADHGHTLMVGPVLDEVVIWLLQRRLDVAERQRWLDEDKARAKKPAPSKPAPAPATPANSLADPQSTAPASTPPAAP
jgi:predicted esterase